MRISYKLTKRTTKTEKIEENFKMYVINLMTIRYKLATSDKIIHSKLNYKFMRPVSILRTRKEKKQPKISNSKQIERDKCRLKSH